MFADLTTITCEDCGTPTVIQDARIRKCLDCYRKEQQEEDWENE